MRFVVVFVVLMVCGCATTKPIEPQRLAQFQRVGAVSLLGDRIHLVQVGTTVFNNVNKYEPVPEWNVDSFAVAEIQKSITTGQAYTFIPIAYQQNDLTEIYQSRNSFPYADFDIEPVKEKLINIGKSNGIDTLILVLSSRLDMTGHNHYLHGYGVFSRSLLGAEVGARFALGSIIAVIDLRNLEVLSRSPINILKRLDRGVWKENLSQYTPEELALLKSFALEGIKSEIPVSLGKMGLKVGGIPQPGK